jgi:hypothetical protein
MKTRSYTPILGLALTALLAASCSTDQAAPVPEGWLSATIIGDAPASYKGTGHFQTMSDLPGWPAEVPSHFYLYSAGTGSSAGDEFILTGYRGERPEVGRYPLGNSQKADPEDGRYDWNLNYHEQRGDSIALYGVVDGEFEVTASSTDAIEGRFSFTAALGMVCSNEMVGRDGDGVPVLPCTFHMGPEPTLVQIDGSFNVLAGLPCTPRSENGTSTVGRPVVIGCVP